MMVKGVLYTVTPLGMVAALDSGNGIVVGSHIATAQAPGTDSFGASRPGNNLFSDSLICVEAKTGKRVWHFQAIHHDLWDCDLVTHPALVDITVDRRPVKAVVGLSKSSSIYALDRKTGKPVWPITEQPVPEATTKNGEWTAPTQPSSRTPYVFGRRTGRERRVFHLDGETAAPLTRLRPLSHAGSAGRRVCDAACRRVVQRAMARAAHW